MYANNKSLIFFPEIIQIKKNSGNSQVKYATFLKMQQYSLKICLFCINMYIQSYQISLNMSILVLKYGAEAEAITDLITCVVLIKHVYKILYTSQKIAKEVIKS